MEQILNTEVRGSPVIANGIVYVNSLRQPMRSISPAVPSCGGRACPPAGPASPAVSDGIVFIGSNDGNLYAFSVNGRAPASRLPGGELRGETGLVISETRLFARGLEVSGRSPAARKFGGGMHRCRSRG